MTPTQRVLTALQEHNCDPTCSGNGWLSRCPAHDDQHASLSIAEGDDGRALVKCHAHCTFNDICAAVGLKASDLFREQIALTSTNPPDARKKQGLGGQSNGNAVRKPFTTAAAAVAELERQHGELSAMWTYQNASGEPVGVIVRWDLPNGAKEIRPVSREGDRFYIAGMSEPRPLYGLAELDGANSVYVVEGEKAADAARAIGLIATTSAHGSQSARKTDWTALAGKSVVILPDNDSAGEEYASEVRSILMELKPMPMIKIVKLPGLNAKNDIVEWIGNFGGAVEACEIRRQMEELVANTEAIEIRAVHKEEELTDAIEIRAAPKESDRARIEFSPIRASQLGEAGQVDWLWYGYAVRGFVTLLVGLWKAGKSTLLAHLLKAAEAGGYLAGEVRAFKVLVITEEGSGLWARRRDEIGIGDHVHFDIRPFKCRPTNRQWRRYIARVAATVKRGDYDLVIFDTWQSLNPCPDENDAAAMMNALLPLQRITGAGAAVLLVHHPRKGDAAEGQASRGSEALPGFVDTIIELRRFDPKRAEDRRRTLRGHSRFEETPAEVVIELTDEGYKSVGSTSVASQEDRQRTISTLLTDGEARTAKEVLDGWPKDGIPMPGRRTVQLDLDHGHAAGKWHRDGRGVKGEPYRYKSIRA
jgi:hypothetical protein